MHKFQVIFLLWWLACCFIVTCITIEVPIEQKLRDDLKNFYGWAARPVRNYTDRLDLFLRFKLTRIADLDLKDQILSLNMLIEHEWTDYKFKWNPNDYGGITQLTLPKEDVWLPDLVFTNFLEYDLLSDSVVVYFTGLIKWTPVTILKNFCSFEIQYYPFDIQVCELVFLSWTYDGDKLLLNLKDFPRSEIGQDSKYALGMDLSEYTASAEWDILSFPAQLKFRPYKNLTAKYPELKFQITVRRHVNYYLANMVLPLIGLSYLSILVFYLPADSGEKITLCISLLSSQIMFLILMIDNIPVTSLAIPLLGKVIIFNMLIVFCSIVCTIMILNVHHRKPSTHELPEWVRNLSHNRILKLLIFLKTPELDDRKNSKMSACGKDGLKWISKREVLTKCNKSFKEVSEELNKLESKIASRIQSAIENICFECEYWKFLARTLDRIFLILFHIIFLFGIGTILIDAPALYDHTKSLSEIESITRPRLNE